MPVSDACRRPYDRSFHKNNEQLPHQNGGTLEVSYTLDFNNDLVSENKFKITVEEKEKFENEVD